MFITIYCIVTVLMFVWLSLAGLAVKTDDDDGFCEFVRNRFGENGESAVNIGLTIIVTVCSILWPLSLLIILVIHLTKH